MFATKQSWPISQGKLTPVLLETITAEQFPMGLCTQQAANLVDGNGDPDCPEWNKLLRTVEARLAPP